MSLAIKEEKVIEFQPRECWRFTSRKRGECKHAGCTFLHISRHGRPFPLARLHEKPYLLECKFFLNGKCLKGEACGYIHIVCQERAITVKEAVSKQALTVLVTKRVRSKHF